MTPQLRAYANRHGDSGVRAYAIHADTLSVEFGDGPVYVYTKRQLGGPLFGALCAAADAGRGLATAIARDVGARYALRFDDRAQWADAVAQASAPSNR